MLAKLSLVFVIARRELGDQARDWRILTPIAFMALVFPFLMNVAAEKLLELLRSYGVGIISDRMVPFLLMVVGFFPISISLVIALESFVGEKERGTIEALLNSPLSDGQLYLGKLLSSVTAPLLGAFLGMGVYLAACVGRGLALPPAEVVAQVFLLTLVQAVLMVTAAVVISVQATTVRSANLLTSFIVIPMALLVQGESMLLVWGDARTLWLAIFGVLVLTVLVGRVGLSHFRREELLGRELDTLHPRALLRLFARHFRGEARSPREWYLREVPSTLRGLGLPFLLVCLLALGAALAGAGLIQSTGAQAAQRALASSESGRLEALADAWPLFDFHPVATIWWQNVRAMLIAMLLGGLTFGVLGTMPVVLTLLFTGYISASVASSGIPLGSYLAGFILPHGVIEIPAVILATAMILKAGAALAAPGSGRGLGEQFVISLADYARLMLGLVIPLLLISAAIEAWVTPRVALLIFGG